MANETKAAGNFDSQVSYTIPAVCKITGIKSPKTVYQEINSGRLRSFQVGRRRLVSAEAIQDWIKAQEAKTQVSEDRQSA